MVAYTFYQDSYGGSALSPEEWAFFGLRAEEKLAYYKRIYTVVASEMGEAMAVCAMAEALAYFSAALSGGGAVSSASIGSVSVSYAQAVELSPKGQERELLRCAKLYLDIYRGASGCC